MTLHLRPVGPLPEAVYWRRRAGVLAGLLVLLLLLSTCGGDDPERETLAQPTPVATLPTALPSSLPPLPTATPTPTVQPCADGVLRVDATPDRPRYATGARPVLRLAVRNAGTVPCSRPLGSGAVELTVFSGADRIWSSDDCSPGGEQGPVVLRPQELEVISLTWSGRRSRPGCPDGAEAIERGTYRVLGRVGTIRTSGTSFLAG